MLNIHQVLEIFNNDTDYLHFDKIDGDPLGFFITGPISNKFLLGIASQKKIYISDIPETTEFFIIRILGGKQTVINSMVHNETSS